MHISTNLHFSNTLVHLKIYFANIQFNFHLRFYTAVTMAIKKSELYSSLWESCDNLRGGMDSSQYKDYILVLLFIKYVSDKKEQLDFIDIPESATFSAMIEPSKGNAEIGDLINKQIVAPFAEACALNVKAMPDFNDSTKLGDGVMKK